MSILWYFSVPVLDFSKFAEYFDVILIYKVQKKCCACHNICIVHYVLSYFSLHCYNQKYIDCFK